VRRETNPAPVPQTTSKVVTILACISFCCLSRVRFCLMTTTDVAGHQLVDEADDLPVLRRAG
jgi:hypothetical protein